VNMENAVIASRHTLLVLTPAYVGSQWTLYEQILTQTQDPIGLRQRTLPVLRQPCELPTRIAMLTYVDLREGADAGRQFARLVNAIRGGRSLPIPPAVPVGGTVAPVVATSVAPAPAPAFNTAAVRELLMAAFNDEELTTFCYDSYRPVCEQFATGMTRPQKVQILVEHCERLAEVLPLFGFYLQPAVGGRILGRSFWARFAAIPNAIAIKIAPFDRYATLEVVRGVAESGRASDVALYTGNDDHILLDLLTPYRVATPGGEMTLRIVGGLLGQWAVWTKRAVEMLDQVRAAVDAEAAGDPALLDLAVRVTDANAAIFDPQHAFAGCISGIHEVLRRQGLLEGLWCLDSREALSPGQADEIDRVCRAYPELVDDDFVAAHLDEWLA